jgi:thiosulfate/3-mercaptopyruvate sulfurtransferase
MRTLPLVVPPAWLAERLATPGLRIVDVRWRLGDPAFGPAAYARGHIPGAVFLDVDRDLAAPRGSGPGRHPLPAADGFAQTMAGIGVGDDTVVCAYDDAGGAVAARLWFLLRYFGHETGTVLDGGMVAWKAAGLSVSLEAPPVGLGARFTARPRPELVVDRAAVAALRSRPSATLLDARQPERYRGELEPVDSRAGHIPGAASAPFAENLTAQGTFRAASELRERYARLGAEAGRDVVSYCGSGVTACHTLLALERAGIAGARLYEGSFSDWSSDPKAEVATGDG